MSTFNGLPVHVLLVHGVVVLLPLAALLLVLSAFWPAARHKIAGPNAILSTVVVVLVPITTDAGEWLEHRVTPSPLVRAHAELGDTVLFVALPVAVLALVIWWRHREQSSAGANATRRTYLAPASATVTAAITVLAVVAAGAAVYDVYRVGDSGAQASWQGKVSADRVTVPRK